MTTTNKLWKNATVTPQQRKHLDRLQAKGAVRKAAR